MAIFTGGRRHFDQDSPLWNFALEALLGDAKRGTQGNRFWIETHDLSTLNVNRLLTFLNDGGNVDDLEIYIKMPVSNYTDDDVPNQLPRDSRPDPTDANPNRRRSRKWSEWKSRNHNHMDATDGEKIIPGSSWGRALNKRQILAVAANPAYTLLLQDDLADHLPEPVELGS